MKTKIWRSKPLGLVICVALLPVCIPGAAAANNDDGAPIAAPFLFIDSVLPDPRPAESETIETLPSLPDGAESRTAALWNWDGQSPVSVQAVFETANQNLGQLEGVEVSVNGQPVPHIWLAALSTAAPSGPVSPDAWLDEVSL